MSESRLGEHASARIGPTVWPSTRLLVDFVLDVADIGRNGGPVLDALILALVMEANVAALHNDPVLQLAYSGISSPAPDELRRPVSVSAVAASLGLPFETVRRRLSRLASLGECVIGPKGVLVPTARLTTPAYVEIAVARYERTRRLYHDLAAIGAIPPSAGAPRDAADPALRPAEAPVRLCDRLLSEYYLRVIHMLMRRLGHPLTGVIMLGLARANIAGLTPAARAAPEILSESHRTPVRRSALAQQLGLPAETVRRRLLDLERRGYCLATPAGMLFAVQNVTQPQALALALQNQANLARFIGRLRRCGVLDLWDAERPAARAGA